MTTAIKPTPGVMDIQKTILKPKKVYAIKQNYFVGSIVTSAAVSTFGSVNIQLSNFANATALGLLFDSYRFKNVTVRFVPETFPAGGTGYPPLLTVLDYDDSVNFTTTAAMRAYDTLYETPFGSYQERTFTPKYAVGTYSGAFTSFSQASGWCDIASASIQWYGLKWGIDTTSAIQTAWIVEVDAIIEFMSPR